MLFWRQGKKVETLVNRHLNLVDSALRAFGDALSAYLEGSEVAASLAKRVNEFESRADDVRREVIGELLHGALLGNYREDMLRLVERTDGLANSADALVNALIYQQIRIPEALKAPVLEMGKKSIDILDQLCVAVEKLFSNMHEVPTHTRLIEKTEGEIDKLEHAAIQALFQMDLPLAEKLWVRDFITHLAQLSDRAEDLSDLLEIIVAKRRT